MNIRGFDRNQSAKSIKIPIAHLPRLNLHQSKIIPPTIPANTKRPHKGDGSHFQFHSPLTASQKNGAAFPFQYTQPSPEKPDPEHSQFGGIGLAIACRSCGNRAETATD
jgi:hypothetical protein